jgi:tRNA pseudouridine38-40 synthase
LILSYDGADFAGWQVQPGRATIQGALASAIGRLTGENVLPQGSGRTDAGVHALAQVASFPSASAIPCENWTRALNHLLPPSIRVLETSAVPPEFHARKSTRAKTYSYRIFRGDVCPPFLARYRWHYPYPLDESALSAAATLVVGKHDFTSFAAVDPERLQRMASPENAEAPSPTSNVRTIFSSHWTRNPSDDDLIYTVRGDGFLHHMVRNLVGTFLLVGKGTLSADDLRRILHARDRAAAGPTAPPSGLFLVAVEY